MNLSKTKKTIGIFLALLFLGVSFSVFAQNNSSSSEGVFADFDQDGLSNEEEEVYGTDPNNEDTDGDGYSDGAEVQSGYDPLKPAPGDKIVKDDNEAVSASIDEDEGVNLTKEIAQRLATAVSAGDEETSNSIISELEDLVEGTLSEDDFLSNLPEIDDSEIKIKEQDYSHFSEEKQARKIKEDEEEYITALAYLAIENSPYRISDPEDIEGFQKEITSKIVSMSDFGDMSQEMEYFGKIAQKGGELLEQMYDLEVPESMIEIHKRGLSIVKSGIALKDEVEINKDDPIGSIISVSRVQDFLLLLIDFQEDINEELERLKIENLDIEL